MILETVNSETSSNSNQKQQQQQPKQQQPATQQMTSNQKHSKPAVVTTEDLRLVVLATISLKHIRPSSSMLEVSAASVS